MYWALNDRNQLFFKGKKNKTSPAIQTSSPLPFVENLCIYKLLKLTVEIVLKDHHYPHHFDEGCLAVCRIMFKNSCRVMEDYG